MDLSVEFWAISKADQNSASENLQNYSFKILIKLQYQNLYTNLATKSWPKFSFEILTKLQFNSLT